MDIPRKPPVREDLIIEIFEVEVSFNFSPQESLGLFGINGRLDRKWIFCFPSIHVSGTSGTHNRQILSLKMTCGGRVENSSRNQLINPNHGGSILHPKQKIPRSGQLGMEHSRLSPKGGLNITLKPNLSHPASL